MHVEGEGILSDMYRALITTFDPMDKVDMSIDTTPCLPDPSIPDFATYQRIGNVTSNPFVKM